MARGRLVVPAAEWENVADHLEQEWRPGDHVTLIGPTGSGKTHAALELADMTGYALLLATKRRDPLLERLPAAGWRIVGSLREIRFAEDRGRWRPLHRHVVYWPARSGEGLEARRKLQAGAMRNALDWIDKTGGWTTVIDETLWFCRNLGLARELESVWFQGRTQGVSLVACAQRPAHVPRLAYSQSRFLFLWRTGDGSDLDRLADISSGIPRRLIERSVLRLDADAHELLFLDAEQRVLARTIAPPRPAGRRAVRAAPARE